MELLIRGVFDCNGPACGAYLPPAGLDQLAIGLGFSAIFLAPGILIHRFLRSRGR